MEQKLKRMFDYQKFQKNSRLEAMLAEAEGRYEGSLSDDALELVSAAGDSRLMLHAESIAYDQRAAVPVADSPPEDCL